MHKSLQYNYCLLSSVITTRVRTGPVLDFVPGRLMAGVLGTFYRVSAYWRATWI